MRRLLPSLLGLALLWPSSGLAATVKLAVVIGNNRGHDPARTLRFAERDARKVFNVLTQLGDFDRRHSRLLLGRPARDVWRALKSVEDKLRKLRREPDLRAVLVVYYSGHADGNVLELGRSSLQYRRLTEMLRSSPAEVRLAFVDSCRSGRLVAAKGGRRARGYRIQVADEVASLGYAVITSSAADELSQESAEIRGSFFTHYLVSALRGAGDQSGDGNVTLGEAYRYAYNRTVARTSATVGGSQHPMYDFKLAGRGDIVLTRTGKRTSLTIVSPTADRIVILDDRAEAMVAETRMKGNRTTRLALAPGTYQVYLLSKGSARRARVKLAAGESRRLSPEHFVKQRLGRSLAKGGLFRHGLRHQLGAGLLVRRMPLEGGAVALGAGLQYNLEFTPGWEALARFSWSTAADVGLSTGFHDLGAHLGVGYRYLFFRTPLHAGALVGYEHLLQDERDGSRHTSSFSWLVTAGLDLPIWRLLITIDGGVGGRVFRLRDEGTVHRLDLQLLVGTGWRWGGV